MVGLCETRKEEVVLKILKDEKENAASQGRSHLILWGGHGPPKNVQNFFYSW